MIDTALDGVHHDAEGGATLLVEGVAGVGKTALIGELGTRADARGCLVLRARGTEMEREYGFGVVRSLFSPLLQTLGEDERSRLFTGPAAAAAAIFGFAGPELEVGAAEPSFYGLFWLVAALAERGPLAIVIDDAHWCDAASIRFCGYLGRRLDSLPLLLTLAARPNEPGVQAEILRGIVADLEMPAVHLEPLSAAGTTTLLRSCLDRPLDATVERACHEATGGNPFLLQELVAQLRTAGEPEAISADAVATLGPGRLATAVVERAGRLDPLAPDLARAAAVLGDAANLRALAALVDADAARTAAIVDGLTGAAILRAPDNLFVHPLVRTAVYESIPAAARAGLHARAAEILEAQNAGAESIAAHLLLCEPGSIGGADATLERAARLAAERGAPESAVAYRRRALEEPGADADRAELLRHLGRTEVTIRDEAAIAHLREAAELTTDSQAALDITAELADLLSVAGQWEAAGATIETALRRFDGSSLRGVLDLEAMRAAYRAYDPRLVAEYDHDLPRLEAIVAGRRDDASLWLRWIIGAIGALRSMPRRRVLDLIQPANGYWSALRGGRESSFLGQAMFALITVDALAECEGMVEQLGEDARRRGSLLAMIGGRGVAAAVASRRGDLETAEAEMGTVLELARDNEMSLMGLTTSLHFALDSLVERRGLAAARALIEELELPPVFAGTQSGAMALEVRAAVRVARGDRDLAVADLREVERMWRPMRIGPRFSQWRSRLALALPEGEREEALELARDGLELAHEVQSPRALGAAQRTLGILTGGEEGIELLDASVATLGSGPMRYELARSLAELGSALRRAKRRGEARARLREAADLCERCGAEALEERVRAELMVAGAKPRRLALSGADSLTAGERRVAGAAADGATNREIAEELFVSLRTIEMHLTNAYRKLGISSRGELAAAIAGD